MAHALALVRASKVFSWQHVSASSSQTQSNYHIVFNTVGKNATLSNTYLSTISSLPVQQTRRLQREASQTRRPLPAPPAGFILLTALLSSLDSYIKWLNINQSHLRSLNFGEISSPKPRVSKICITVVGHRRRREGGRIDKMWCTCSCDRALVAGPPAAGRRRACVLTRDVDEQRRRADECDLGGATFLSFLPRAPRSFRKQGAVFYTRPCEKFHQRMTTPSITVY